MRFALVLVLFFRVICLRAQSKDSIYHQLQEVEVTGVTKESVLRLPASESIITRFDFDQQSSYSLLPALNTIPGVRMEERSPGSYRLSIRGSLLRSPFGVRNVKIYLMDFPFTDAGGNTYLNTLDITHIGSVRVLKGPEASIFGANTGGVLLVDPIFKTPNRTSIGASISGGSFGLFQEAVSFQKQGNRALFNITQAYQSSDGYRENSRMKRNYSMASGTWSYHKKAFLKALLLFSDLFYQTPGGLTLLQYTQNPQQARPSTGLLPGASEQKAAVMNRFFFAGVSHDRDLTEKVRHVFSVFGSNADFKNPFITNFEQREEQTYGIRTYIDVISHKSEKMLLKWDLGGEWQQTNSLIENYGNNAGTKDTLQVSDHLKTRQAFVFGKFLADLNNRLLIELSASYNFFNYRYRNKYPSYETNYHQRDFSPVLMPRLAFSYLITSYFSWRSSVSFGYSVPTVSEIRSSDNTVNSSLQAEKGQNYETGFRIQNRKKNIWLDLSTFYYTLTNAIVRRVDSLGNEFFVNAGGTCQPGVEGELKVGVVSPRSTGIIRSLHLRSNVTYYLFTFREYQVGLNDYSGKRLTGVPEFTMVGSISAVLPLDFGIYIQYYYSDRIPLTDGNTEYAKEYHLIQMKVEWKKHFRRFSLSVFTGVDNLLNQQYSLGNDLNAMGGRYYNAAPLRNYYGGLKLNFKG